MRKIFSRFFLMFCLFLLNTHSVWAQESSSPQQNEFGQIALLSCTNALRTRAPLYLGVEITPNENWDVQLENLNITTSTPIPVDWFIPFEQPFRDRQIFPISAVLTQKQKEPITFNAQGSVKACHQSACKTYPISVAKTLTTDFVLITPECDGITHALSRTPIPMHMEKIKGWAIPENDQIQVTLDFPHPPKTVQVYTLDKKPFETNITIKEKRAQFPWPIQTDDLHFFVRTYYGYYEVQLPLLPPQTTVPIQRITLWQILQTAVLFFLLSAFPIFWARSTDAPYKTFLKQTKQSLILIGFVGLILSLTICFYGPLELTFTPFGKIGSLIWMALGIIFIPAHIFLPFLFTFLAPRPYLSFIQDPSEQLIFIIMATIIAEATFALQLFWAKKIFKKLQAKEATGYIWWCCRLPWLFLMFYIMIYL